MSDMFCSYSGRRDEILVAYVYDEVDPVDRLAFESHLATCAACRLELEELGAIRSRLAEWTPPEPVSLASRSADVPRGRTPAIDRTHWWREMPAWAQVAAAGLFLGVSAGLANLDVRYDAAGLSVRTGWSAPAPVTVGAPAVRSAGDAGTKATGAATPWRADLANLEERLRGEIHTITTPPQAQAVAASTGDPGDAGVLRRVKALIDQSERKQQRELALHVAQVVRDVQAQRQADLTNIERNLGAIQNNTGFEVMRQRELLNSLAVRVSQTR
jgi:hypothetical protein